MLEAFPFGAARIVDVNVRIDEARRHGERAGVDLPFVPARTANPIVARGDGGDAALTNVHGGRPHAVGQDDAIAANDERRGLFHASL